MSLCFKLTCIALVWVHDQVDFCADINYLLSVHSTRTITETTAGNLGKPIRFLFFKLFEDPQKPEKSISVLKVFGKIDFHYAGGGYTPYSLQLLRSFHEPEGQVARWLETLSEYYFDVVHRPGKRHTNADSLSRMPCSQCRLPHEEDSEDHECVLH